MKNRQKTNLLPSTFPSSLFSSLFPFTVPLHLFISVIHFIYLRYINYFPHYPYLFRSHLFIFLIGINFSYTDYLLPFTHIYCPCTSCLFSIMPPVISLLQPIHFSVAFFLFPCSLAIILPSTSPSSPPPSIYTSRRGILREGKKQGLNSLPGELITSTVTFP